MLKIGHLILMIFSTYGIIFGSDCVILKNSEELCGKIVLRSEDLWCDNEITVNDSLKVNFAEVKKIEYNGKVYLRAVKGAMLSNFAQRLKDGTISVYSKRCTSQFGIHTFYNSRSGYFTLNDDSLFELTMDNLRVKLSNYDKSGNYLEAAKKKKIASRVIRFASIIPFYIGLSRSGAENPADMLVPMCIGTFMLILPAFTFTPSINNDMEYTIEAFNRKFQK